MTKPAAAFSRFRIPPSPPPVKRAAMMAAFIGVAFLGGCATGIPMATTKPAVLSAAVAHGIPSRFHANVGEGYWIGVEDDGTWHVRVTSGVIALHFQGRIHPLAGATISDLGLEGEANGRRRNTNDATRDEGDVVFEFQGVNHGPGFRFRMAGRACLEFDLRINGDGDAAKIFIGERNVVPARAHFMLCLPENEVTTAAPAPLISAPPGPPTPPPRRKSAPPPPAAVVAPAKPAAFAPIRTIADLDAALHRLHGEHIDFLQGHRALAIDFRHVEEAVTKMAKAPGQADVGLIARYDDALTQTIALALEISTREAQRPDAKMEAAQFAAELKQLPAGAKLPFAAP